MPSIAEEYKHRGKMARKPEREVAGDEDQGSILLAECAKHFIHMWLFLICSEHCIIIIPDDSVFRNYEMNNKIDRDPK